MKNPFLVVITFCSGQVMYLEARTRTGVRNIAKNYRELVTVKSVRVYQEFDVDKP